MSCAFLHGQTRRLCGACSVVRYSAGQRNNIYVQGVRGLSVVYCAQISNSDCLLCSNCLLCSD